MGQYIFSVITTMIEIIIFSLSYLIEKVRCKSIEDEEKAQKALKRSKNIFYMWTDISIILSILVILSVLSNECHLILFFVYGILQLLCAFIYIIKKKRLTSVFAGKLFLGLLPLGIVATVIYMLSLAADFMYDAAKPIIYIYPETETTVQVSVGYPEKLSCVYPEYENGWQVIAKPNGDLIDTKTGRNLYCLYWEGDSKLEYKFKDGFVVAGEDSAKFLEEKLAILGLNEREANEFIIYWLPKLEANKYNLIRFETMEEIEAYMPLNIEPKPDTLIRIVMDFKGLNRPIEIEEQQIETPIREGYIVVEWGGSEF